GAVDTADYVLWRKHAGQNYQLKNEVSNTTPGQATAEDYAAWRARFGSRAAGAAGTGMISGAVPEPNILALLAAGLFWAVFSCRPGQSRRAHFFHRRASIPA
ncbi:MAG TPA: PEP-CTERM sorting domain-containing protein, partial [Lacipirellulaceae bacterium]|nr:PEP-CTERM sorting domain-containing protein [Lacipirellulaceae bacterium]